MQYLMIHINESVTMCYVSFTMRFKLFQINFDLFGNKSISLELIHWLLYIPSMTFEWAGNKTFVD